MDDSGFIGSPERITLLDGVPEALRLLEAAGFARIVITNQSGVARGFFGESDVENVHETLAALLLQAGATIDAFYHCTHLNGCSCRKPLTGMVERAMLEHSIDVKRSVVFGDRWSDIGLAQNLGIPGILISHNEYAGPEPAFQVGSLLEGVRRFLEVDSV
jgi:histidinol-phosphate phosphatase family protein